MEKEEYNMAKFIITIDQDDIDDIVVEADDPTYDGPESNIEDPEGVYHVEANTEDEAIKTARWLDSLGNPAYSEPSESEYM
jgi:hypothetical protein